MILLTFAQGRDEEGVARGLAEAPLEFRLRLFKELGKLVRLHGLAGVQYGGGLPGRILALPLRHEARRRVGNRVGQRDLKGEAVQKEAVWCSSLVCQFVFFSSVLKQIGFFSINIHLQSKQ